MTKDAILMGVAALPLAYAVLVVLAAMRVRRIARFPEAAPDVVLPRLSIVVPACNEESTLDAALRSKLASRYPNLEVVIVDDRSTDATGKIADAIAQEDPRLKVVHVKTLPEGWLGKINALARGAAAASGDIILFSDADVRFSPDLLVRAVATMEREQLDFVTMTPHLVRGTFALDATLTTMMRTLVVAGRIWKMRDPKSKVAVGAGLFNMVRRSALARSPGLEWLKMEVADDAAFGQMIKYAGGKCDVFNGTGDVTLAFYESLREMKHGLEKNAYAGSSYRLGIAAVMLTVLFYAELGPIVVGVAALASPIAAGALTMVLAAALLMSLAQMLVARWLGRSLVTAAVPYWGPAVLFWLSVRSIFLAHLRGGIYWRGTFYRLEDLRRGSRIARV